MQCLDFSNRAGYVTVDGTAQRLAWRGNYVGICEDYAVWRLSRAGRMDGGCIHGCGLSGSSRCPGCTGSLSLVVPGCSCGITLPPLIGFSPRTTWARHRFFGLCAPLLLPLAPLASRSLDGMVTSSLHEALSCNTFQQQSRKGERLHLPFP